MTDERRDLAHGSGWWEASDGRWYPPVDRRPPPPLPRPPERPTGDTTPAGAWLAIAGGALMAVGTLLPWVLVAGLNGIARNGFQLGANESVTIDGPVCLILGLITIVIGITRLTQTSMPRFIQRSSIITGVVVGLVLAVDYSGIHGLVKQISAGGFVASIGYGYWVCGVGAVVAVAGGIVLRSGQPGPGLSRTGMWIVVVLVLAVAAVALGLNVGSGTTTSSVSPTAAPSTVPSSGPLSGSPPGSGADPTTTVLPTTSVPTPCANCLSSTNPGPLHAGGGPWTAAPQSLITVLNQAFAAYQMPIPAIPAGSGVFTSQDTNFNDSQWYLVEVLTPPGYDENTPGGPPQDGEGVLEQTSSGWQIVAALTNQAPGCYGPPVTTGYISNTTSVPSNVLSDFDITC